MAAKLIVGLGNPGSKYQWTRHNAGFMVLDRFSQETGIQINRKTFSGLLGEGSYGDFRLLLLKPQTFMNLSGRSVAAAVNFHRITLENIMVVHDELDIPFGQVKLKEGGGHSGHNGLRSILQELGSGEFLRIRVGIGRPPGEGAAEYVLSNYSRDEMMGLPSVIDSVVDMVKLVMEEGIGKAMSLYHNRNLLD